MNHFWLYDMEYGFEWGGIITKKMRKFYFILISFN